MTRAKKDMRVKSKYKNENKEKKTTQSVRSAQSGRSAVCSLQSAWSAFWGDPVRDVLLISNHEVRFSFVKNSGKTT